MVWSSSPAGGRSELRLHQPQRLIGHVAAARAAPPPSRRPCTTRTPGTFSAALVSTLFSVAPCAGGRRIRACNSPGGSMSPAYLALPVTLSSASLRARRFADHR